MFGDVACDCRDFQVNPAKSHMAVGTQQIERGLDNLRACQFHVIDRISGNDVDAQQIAKTNCAFRRRRLPDHNEIEMHIIEFLEQILHGAVRLKFELKPREAIARTRRAMRDAFQRLR